MNDIPTHSILPVDDDPAMRDVMAMLLNEEGYDVSTAINGLDALNQLMLATPDLIISDLNMPQMRDSNSSSLCATASPRFR